MLIDFPNYSHSNPWQTKTIQTSAPMEVKVTSSLDLSQCYALHISWEDVLLRSCDTMEKANHVITQFEEYLHAQSLRSKIIWTVHNLTSHSYPLKDAEKKLRSVIVEYASIINLMSVKHAFIIPDKHQSKINIVPHYIDSCHFPQVEKNTDLTFFKYGADRGRTDNDFYLKVLNNPKNLNDLCECGSGKNFRNYARSCSNHQKRWKGKYGSGDSTYRKESLFF